MPACGRLLRPDLLQSPTCTKCLKPPELYIVVGGRLFLHLQLYVTRVSATVLEENRATPNQEMLLGVA